MISRNNQAPITKQAPSPNVLEPDQVSPFIGETPAVREFSAVFWRKAYLNGTVFDKKVVKNPESGVLAGRGYLVRFLIEPFGFRTLLGNWGLIIGHWRHL